MALDGLLYMSVGFNFIQTALLFRERRLRREERERFALYIKKVDAKISKLERKSRNAP